MPLFIRCAGIHLDEEFFPLIGYRFGVGSGIKPDIVVEAPFRGVIKRLVSQIHGHFTVGEQRVPGKILKDGHYFTGILGRGLFGVAPYHISDAKAQLFGRRARDNYALCPFQVVDIACNGLEVEDVEQ